MAMIERTNAGRMTNMPIRRNFHVPTSSPSRRRTINQRMVASEPVTDRFGPRSTDQHRAGVRGHVRCERIVEFFLLNIEVVAATG
jgi:hypothetical protein